MMTTVSGKHWHGKPEDNPYVQERTPFQRESFQIGSNTWSSLSHKSIRIEMDLKELKNAYHEREESNTLELGDFGEHARMVKMYKKLLKDQKKIEKKYDRIFADQKSVYMKKINS